MNEFSALTCTALLAASIAVGTQPATATQRKLFESGAWRAVEAVEAGRRLCFAIASPVQRVPLELKRDPGNFFVTLKKGKSGAKTEISIEFGYRLAGSGHMATIDDRGFDLISSGEAAWVRSEADETDIVEAMKAGRDLRVTAISARGNRTTDLYGLDGFTAALSELQKRCGS